MPSSLESLPNELIYLIIDHLHKSDVKPLRITASFHTAVTEPALFGSITIAPYKQSFRDLLTLSASPLGVLVKNLVYDTRHLCVECGNHQELEAPETEVGFLSNNSGSSSALTGYNDDLVTSMDLPIPDFRAITTENGIPFSRSEFEFLFMALEGLPNLRSAVVTDGHRQYNNAAPLPAFHMRMLRECGLKYLEASYVSASPAYTADRSCTIHTALVYQERIRSIYPTMVLETCNQRLVNHCPGL